MTIDAHQRRKAFDQAHALVLNFDDPFEALTNAQRLALRIESFTKGEVYDLPDEATVEIKDGDVRIGGDAKPGELTGVGHIAPGKGTLRFAPLSGEKGDPKDDPEATKAAPAEEPAPVKAKRGRPRKAPKARAARKVRGPKGNGHAGETAGSAAATPVETVADTVSAPASVAQRQPEDQPQMAA